ncbi:MAG: dTMP kinase [Bacteroidota bacterium]|nr:dTMP kinase [Bacteroidota bacterium]
MFITFEGIDCCGKSTQVKLLVEKLQQQSRDFVLLREPGGTPISEHIREILLDKKHSKMIQITELLLFSASRAQLVSEVIKPALQQNKIVICDRYVDSTTVYQGYGRGLSIGAVKNISRVATTDVMPKKTFLLDISVHEMHTRRDVGKHEADRMETSNEEFYQRVRNGYLQLAKEEPERFVVIDGKQPIDAIHDQIMKVVDEILPIPEE